MADEELNALEDFNFVGTKSKAGQRRNSMVDLTTKAQKTTETRPPIDHEKDSTLSVRLQSEMETRTVCPEMKRYRSFYSRLSVPMRKKIKYLHS